MNPRPVSAVAIALTLVAVLAVVLPTIYVAGYIGLSENLGVGSPFCGYRAFPSEWLAAIYEPAAEVESVFGGYDVDLIYHAGPGLTGFN